MFWCLNVGRCVCWGNTHTHTVQWPPCAIKASSSSVAEWYFDFASAFSSSTRMWWCHPIPWGNATHWPWCITPRLLSSLPPSLPPSLSPKYISITPPLLLSTRKSEPSLCLGLTARQSWFCQYCAPQSRHLSEHWKNSKLCKALPPSWRAVYADLKALTAFTRIELESMGLGYSKGVCLFNYTTEG